MKEYLQILLKEIMSYKQWIETLPKDVVELDCIYDRWNDIYAAFKDMLNNITPKDADNNTVEQLLYIISKNNEEEILIGILCKNKRWFFFLCKYALEYKDKEARWQFAAYLGAFPTDQESKSLILRFVSDPDEYVNRRALSVMPLICPDRVEYYAKIFWERNIYGEMQVYQRIAVLMALHAVNSSLLKSHIQKAFKDGREYLVSCAKNILKQTEI